MPNSLPIPEFVDFARVGELWQERSAMLAEEAIAWRTQHNITPSQQDTTTIAMFGIDCQVGFVHPGASLQVPGAMDDMVRATQFLYRNLDHITQLFFSLDTHFPYQVFHPGFWKDRHGNPLPPFTPVTAQEFAQGQKRPIEEAPAVKEYLHSLEEAGKYNLMIWPYHCLLGGLSHALVPLVMESALFHAWTRQVQPHIELKGMHPLTENYSVLEPEIKTLQGRSVGTFNESLFQKLMAFDRIYVWGEASSHCVKATLESLQMRIEATQPDALRKIYILTDCMSPVPSAPHGPNFAELTDHFLQTCAANGMNLVQSTDPIFPNASNASPSKTP